MDPVVAHSKAIIEQGSKSFAAAAKLFDPVTRERAFMLYAWCRYCDDSIDGQSLGFAQNSPAPAQQLAILEELTIWTESAMAGEPQTDPIFQALQRVYRECDIERRYPLELLEGFAMDVRRHRYLTLEDTLLYSYHVAGVVGAMMASIMGVRDPSILKRAVDLGIAFQLTNIARDVMEDAADDRVYLPSDWLTAEGVASEPGRFPGQEAALSRVVERLLVEADRYYESADIGITALPFRSAWAVAAARGVYREIGLKVRGRGAAAWQSRVSVSGARKIALIASSSWIATRAAVGRSAGATRTGTDGVS